MEAVKLIKQYETIKSTRMPMESSWEELHKVFYAMGDEIQSASPADAKIYRKYQYTDAPYQALQVLSAGLHSNLTGPTNNWFALRPTDLGLQDDSSITRFLENTESRLRSVISNTNFETEQDAFYSESACYGSAVMLIEEDAEDVIRFNTIPIKDMFWQENSRGRIDRWYIRYNYTAAQAVDRFGIKKVSEKIRECYNKDSADDTKYEFLFHVAPRTDRNDTKLDALNMPIASYWIDVEERKVISEGGFNESPFAYHRFYKRKSTPYGYSPCMMSLKSANCLNETIKISMRAMLMATDGPMDVPVNAYVGKIDLNPGSLLTRKGDEKMSPIRTNTQIAPADWLIKMQKDDLKEGLFNKAIIALGDVTKRMHSLEVSELIAEKMVLLGPAVGRYLDEFAESVIKRCLAILARRGELPEAPESLGEGFEYKIEFISPLAKAQRHNEAQAINSVLQSAGGMAQLAPEVVDNINPDSTIRELADITGATIKMFRTPDQVKSIREARIQAQQEQEQVAQAQQGLDMGQQMKEIENGNNKGS